MRENRQRNSYKIRQKRLSKVTYSLLDVLLRDRYFFLFLVVLSIIAFFIQDYIVYAKWFGFAVASYGLITNDSIQTLGVFITSNAHRTTWWAMWFFTAAVFSITVWCSWLLYEGDVSYQRLQTEGLEECKHITFGNLLAPIVLLFMTRLGLPVSTTFLLLVSFATNATVILNMITKSLLSYCIAFLIAFCVWSTLLYRKTNKKIVKKKKLWVIVQWISSGLLWAAWLMQDGANMAIFLPRHLTKESFVLFVLFIWILLGLLFSSRGGKMQRIVDKKTGITDIKAASLVNIFYMALLLAFTIASKIPMSSTWMFIGLLGGRELAAGFWLKSKKKSKKQQILKSVFLIRRDMIYAFIGLVISIVLSCFVNAAIRNSLGFC